MTAGGISSAAIVSLSTVEPDAPFDELEPLARWIGDDVRVVAIGESVHGAHEFYGLRHRLLRFLVERLGFTALAWESGFPEGFLVDDFIHGRRNDLEDVQVAGMTMHLGRCRELGALLNWLREHNAGKAGSGGASESVHFYGLDLPGSTAAIRPPLEMVTAYVDSVDPGFGPRLARIRELLRAFPLGEPERGTKIAGGAVVKQYLAISAVDRNELTGLVADLGARFDAHRRTYVARSDAERYDVARQVLRSAAQLDLQLRAVAALMAGDAAACEANIRDATMADTVEWVLGRHERVIVLAHNGHIQRTPIATPTGTSDSVDTLGVHLAQRLGDKYLAIGTTCGGGEIIAMRPVTTPDGSFDSELYLRELPPLEDGAVDGVLEARLGQLALVDLRSLDAETATAIDAAPRMRMQDLFFAIDARAAFDMLLHVPRISLWESEMNTMVADERVASSE